MFVFNWKAWLVLFYYRFYALPCCCLLPLRAVAHLLMGVMVYYRVQHENKAISSRFADLPATLCVAVYYRWRTTVELACQQSFECAAGRLFLCFRRWIGDSWALLSQRCTALKASRLMSRFITASPPLLILATWWFITVSQPPSTSIMSRFIHLVDAFCRSVLLPFLSLGASGFRLARAVSFCSVLGHPGVLNLTYVCLYEDIYTYITAICI